MGDWARVKGLLSCLTQFDGASNIFTCGTQILKYILIYDLKGIYYSNIQSKLGKNSFMWEKLR
jgi:hypothetical protein